MEAADFRGVEGGGDGLTAHPTSQKQKYKQLKKYKKMTLNEMQQEMDRGNWVYFQKPNDPMQTAHIADMYWGFKNKKRVTTGNGLYCGYNKKRRYFDTLEDAVKYLEDNGYICKEPQW